MEHLFRWLPLPVPTASYHLRPLKVLHYQSQLDNYFIIILIRAFGTILAVGESNDCKICITVCTTVYLDTKISDINLIMWNRLKRHGH